MFADYKRRAGSVRACRESLRAVALVALAAALLAAPATAAAMPHGAPTDRHATGSGVRGGENLLAGSPRIGAVKALVPRRGRHAGRLLVWVRVEHAPGTRRALARQLPETIHSGRVVTRVGKRSRFAIHRLELNRSRGAYGYFLRFSKPATRAVAAAAAGGRVRVSLRVAQTLDVDSDGDHEDRAQVTTTRTLQLARPATTIEPDDGRYVSDRNNDSLTVSNGAITDYVVTAGTCDVPPVPFDAGGSLDPPSPIDPSSGDFEFVDVRSSEEGEVSVGIIGSFMDDGADIQGVVISTSDAPGSEGCTSEVNGSLLPE